MRDRENIYNNFFRIETDNYAEIVNYFESNSLYFGNKSKFESLEEFEDFSIVVSLYILSLECLGRYKKVIVSAETYLPVVYGNVNSFDLSLSQNDCYKGILVSKARSSYKLKDYKSSIGAFNELTKLDTDSDYFKNWLMACHHRYRNRFSNVITILAITFFLISVIIVDRSISRSLLIIGFVLLLTNALNNYWGEKKIKWTEYNGR